MVCMRRVIRLLLGLFVDGIVCLVRWTLVVLVGMRSMRHWEHHVPLGACMARAHW